MEKKLEGINVINLKDGEIYNSVEVVKNTKGYNWTVKCVGIDIDKVMERVKKVEKELNEKFG